MIDSPDRTLNALKALIPREVDDHILQAWRNAAAVVLVGQGLELGLPDDSEPPVEDVRTLDGMDARAEAEILASVIFAAIRRREYSA